MGILTPGKALRSLPKTPALLNHVLRDVTQEQAVNSWDGPWNVVYVVCHLRDMEIAFTQRLHTMLETDHPTFPANDPDAMAVENHYAEADLRQSLAEFEARRRQFIALLQNLTPEQWERTGMHPFFGATTVITLAVNSAIHDLDHIEQIARALGKITIWS